MREEHDVEREERELHGRGMVACGGLARKVAGRMLRRMSRTWLAALLALAAVLTLAASPVAAKGPLSAEQAEAVRTYVGDVLAELNVPGAAVVIVGPEGILLAEGFGADGRGGAPTPQTPFQIASLSKQLTAIAVMQLIEAGDLDLDAPVHAYVDWFGSEGSETARITVRNLLAHASGWTQRDGLVNRARRGMTPMLSKRTCGGWRTRR